MESNEKVIHEEVLEGLCQTKVRIATQVEGEEQARVFDIEGQGVMGVMITKEGPIMNGQAFVVGADIPSILQGMEVLINMVNTQLSNDKTLPGQMARMALATLLMSKADQIVEDVIA